MATIKYNVAPLAPGCTGEWGMTNGGDFFSRGMEIFSRGVDFF